MNGLSRLSRITKASASLAVAAFIPMSVLAQGPYPDKAGTAGSTAVHKDASIFVSWATGIEVHRGWVNMADTSVTYNGSNKASFGVPALALGQATGEAFDAISLGDGGMATLTFDRPIKNEPGADFAVFENSASDSYLELAFVEVSSDGKHFVRFPASSLTPTTTQIGGFGALEATNIHNLAGKYKQGYGTPFDLEDLKDSAHININNIRFLRIIDVVGNIAAPFANYDANGNTINDPWPTPYHSCGFDLEAVGIIHGGTPYTISTFDELFLSKDSFWNPTTTSNFSSGNAVLHFISENYNNYGFVYSNQRNDSVCSYTNAYSAITAGGINAPDSGGTNYACAYISNNWPEGKYDETIPVNISFKDHSKTIVNGCYITNSTYTYLSMKKGDAFSKKFGGLTGNEPDFLRLLIWGIKEDETLTDTVVFYLADFRNADNTKDYIVDTWKWIDTQHFGEIVSLQFSIESSDNGAFGINTPAYFCMDNLSIQPSNSSNYIPTHQYLPQFSVFPNPFQHSITVKNDVNSTITLTDICGRILLQQKTTNTFTDIATSELTNGYYILSVANQNGITTRKVLKQ